MGSLIRSAALDASLCNVTWSDGHTTAFPALWLRDHCGCPDCLHPETHQRLVDTFSLPDDLMPQDPQVADNGRALILTWSPERHSSRYEADLLRRLADGKEPTDPVAKTLWDAATLAEEGLGEVPAEGFLSDDDLLAEALTKLDRRGFLFVEGLDPTPEATQAVARRISYIRETIFGGFWDFTANMEHKDTAYTTLEIGPHTDGTYSFDGPGYQMFHCLAFEGTGGESLLVDGFRVAREIQERAPDLYRVLGEIAVPGQYLDHERGVHLLAKRPVLRHDSDGALIQVSYNNHDRAAFLPDRERLEAFYEGLRLFHRLANDPAFQMIERLAPGRMLIFDNWRTLHGRKAYQGKRRLAGAYINKEDVESRLRVLQLKGAV
ncbi:trimethyllysine dioxygenase [Limibacillus sp. MBR-115]|jgi:trimethyllysine dioxygenase|uniref:trimethyllysine dioxygenase n=1 Tax=Limibacillus sp. MBR-115 TaxID=3156465 RepID=UPI0033993A45